MADSNNDIFDNIQTRKIDVTKNAFINNAYVKQNGLFTTNGNTCFKNTASIVIDGLSSFNGILETPLLSPISPMSTIIIDSNVNVNNNFKIKTNYLAPSFGSSVMFNDSIVTDIINEKMPNDGMLIDGALIQDGVFYGNGSVSPGNRAEIQANKNIANGYAGLDANGLIPISLLPSGTIYFKGTWDANMNIPSLSSGVGTFGDYYIVSVAGTTNLDSSNIWSVGDALIFDSTWIKLNSDADVKSVNGFTNAVSLKTNNIAEGTNKYYTDARVSMNSDVSANTSHRMQVTGNAHTLTAAHVGNTTAQWNANQIQGRDVSPSAPSNGQYLAWDNSMSQWIPTTVATAVPSGIIKMDVNGTNFSLVGTSTISSTWNSVFSTTGYNFLNGTWTFPVSGNYRIFWGGIFEYGTAGVHTGQLILDINGTNASIINMDITGGQCYEARGVWYQNITAGQTGALRGTNSSVTTINVTGFFVSIEKW
jgi:hypothetical protein